MSKSHTESPVSPSPLGRLARLIGGRLPPRLQALVEFYGRSTVRDSWGGPFNGQERRREIVRELFTLLPFAAVVETGTYRGTTTEFFAREMSVPVYSVEAVARFFHYSRMRLRSFPHVHLSIGDSRDFLGTLARRASFPKDVVFFYLDAHWYEDLPLVDELEIIRSHWNNFVVMVDDFEVPSDSGYAFDDYGAEKKLCLDLFPPLAELGLSAFFPESSSSTETGKRRGAVVLADPVSAKTLQSAVTLRHHSA